MNTAKTLHLRQRPLSARHGCWARARRRARARLSISASTLFGGLGMLLFVVGGCSSKRLDELEQRVVRLEAQLAAAASSASTPDTSSTVPNDRVKCARAKVACADAWEKTLAGAKAVRDKGGRWHDGPHQGWNKAQVYDGPKAAHSACSTNQGAIRIRDTAKAVELDDSRPEVAEAKFASEAAFDACRDIEP